MTTIFNFFGNIFGYILWFAFLLVKNYGVAIIIFTVILKAIMFPFSIKQQKSMAANARIQSKMAEIRKKYGNNKEKFNEETAKLYEKEGISPTGGCLTSLAPMLFMLGVYYSVINPLTNTVHVASASVTKIVDFVTRLPGIGTKMSTYYSQIEAVKIFPSIKDYISGIDAADIANIEKFNKGFNFLGLDLLSTPSESGFWSMLWIIPVLCLVTSWLASFLQMKLTGANMPTQGCVKYMLLLMPLLSAYIAYKAPAAVGFYWIISTVLGFLTTIILQRWYSPAIMEAKAEASRVARLELEEKEYKYTYMPRPALTEGDDVDNSKKQQNNSGNKNNKKKKKK